MNHQEGSIENCLYLKCWIDTVQWHFEDIIRDPQIDPAEAPSKAKSEGLPCKSFVYLFRHNGFFPFVSHKND